MIEKKGVNFDNDFGYSFPIFSSLLKKRKRRKRRMNRQKSFWKVMPFCSIDPNDLFIYKSWPSKRENLEYISQQLWDCIKKIYFKIDQHLARHFMYYGMYLSIPPPFLCSQIITSFPNPIISTNQETGI